MPYSIGIDVKGAKKVEQRIAGFVSAVEDGLRDAVESTVREGATLASLYAPVDTGELSQSIEWHLDADGLGGRWGPDPADVKARVMEYGSKGPYEIRPKNAKVLAFPGRDGKTVFAKRVMHPGVQGRFYLKKSRDAVQAEFVRACEAAVSRAARGR